MSSTSPALQHLAFFDRLSGLEESSADWRALKAGLVTLRLLDAWMMDGRSVVAADAWGLRAVREAIGAVHASDATRALLTSIVDCMVQVGAPSASIVAARVMAYGRSLQFNAQWELAGDVYRTLLVYCQPLEDADVVIAANMQLARCLRVLARWNEAIASYSTAAQVAALTGDVMNVLKARIGEANVAIDRGNLPRAEMLLDDAIHSADDSGLAEVRAIALQDRAHVALRRGQFEVAVPLQWRALEDARDQTVRDRILLDLGASFYEMGLRSAARDAFLVLAATASEQYTRWTATLNLLDIAVADRREPVFEQYRRELSDVELPPMLAAYYHVYVGRGQAMFGRQEAAHGSLQRAIDIAHHYQLSQVLFEAEQCLESIRTGGTGRREQAVVPEVSTEVSDVANAVREMRTLAGVAG